MNMNKTMTNNRKMTDSDLKKFQNKNVFEMSVNELNYYFERFSQVILDNAVYPHLALQK